MLVKNKTHKKMADSLDSQTPLKYMDHRLPNKQLQLASAGEFSGITYQKIYPSGFGNVWINNTTSQSIVFDIASSSRNQFWNPSQSTFLIEVRLKNALGNVITTVPIAGTLNALGAFDAGQGPFDDYFVYRGPHTLFKTVEVLASSSNTILESVESADVLGQISSAYLPESFYTSLGPKFGMFPIDDFTVSSANRGDFSVTTVDGDTSDPANARVHMQYNTSAIRRAQTLLLRQQQHCVMVPSSVLNLDCLMPGHQMPLRATFQFANLESWLTSIGLNNHRLTPNSTPVSYEVRMCYLIKQYTLSQESSLAIEQKISSPDGLKIQYERCFTNATQVGANSSESTISIVNSKISNMTRYLGCFLQNANLNSVVRDRYLFSNLGAFTNTDAYAGINQWSLTLGMQNHPMLPITLDHKSMEMSELITKTIGASEDWEQSTAHMIDSNSIERYQGIYMIDQLYYNRLNNKFHVGYNFRKDAGHSGSGASMVNSPLLVNLRATGINSEHRMFNFVFYSSAFTIRNGTVSITS